MAGRCVHFVQLYVSRAGLTHLPLPDGFVVPMEASTRIHACIAWWKIG